MNRRREHDAAGLAELGLPQMTGPGIAQRGVKSPLTAERRYCLGCGFRLDRLLVELGELWHPCCTPGVDCRTAAERASARRRPVSSYSAAHQRVRRERGRAPDHDCVDCAQPATEWSYDHGDPGELVDDRGRAYSLDPGRYEPRCQPCHARFDRPALTDPTERTAP